MTTRDDSTLPRPPSREALSQHDPVVRLGYISASPLAWVPPGARKREALPTLAIEGELKAIRSAIKETGKKVTFQAEIATPERFRRLLNKGCTMLHYSGHGFPETNMLAFEQGDGEKDKCGMLLEMNADDLGRLFRAGGVVTSVVFVSACHSQAAGERFVAAGVKHVVAVKTKDAVTDMAATAFASSFYSALLEGLTVTGSFEAAISCLMCDKKTRPDVEGNKFLLMPDWVDHNVVVFPHGGLRDGAFNDQTKPLPYKYNLPVSREVVGDTAALDIQRVVEGICSSSCVTITGGRASGKTLQAIMACSYVLMRRQFENIFFVDVAAHCTSLIKDDILRDKNLFSLLKTALNKSGGSLVAEEGADNSERWAARELLEYLFLERVSDRVGDTVEGKVLLVLDGVDTLTEGVKAAHKKEMMGAVVNTLNEMLTLNNNLVVLSTCQERLTQVPNALQHFINFKEKVLSTRRLTDTECAQLLYLHRPRGLSKEELAVSENDESVQTMEQCFVPMGQLPAIQVCEGHPGTLLQLVHALAAHTLHSQAMVSKAKAIRASYLPCDLDSSTSSRSSAAGSEGPQDETGSEAHLAGLPNELSKQAWARATGGVRTDAVTWESLKRALESQICTCKGDGSGVDELYSPFSEHTPRGLYPEDSAYLWRRLWVLAGKQAVGPPVDAEEISRDVFVLFGRWWGPTLKLLRFLEAEWNFTLVLIHGFMGRTRAEELLLGKPMGAFLLRFSESEPGSLVISYNESVRNGQPGITRRLVTHVVVKLENELLYLTLNDGPRQYKSLPDLIVACNKLTILCPDHDKRVFSEATYPSGKA